MKTESNVC